MEDPSEEWKIEEHSAEANCGKLRWILNMGLIVGRKILIAGIVVSSTPIVLPPILAITAIGFALSVPSGFLLASYACSEMLMRKLLPSNDEEEVYWDEEEEEESVGFGGEYYYMEKEEEELMEETKRRVEMRIELLEEEVEENKENEILFQDKDVYGRGEIKGEVEELKEVESVVEIGDVLEGKSLYKNVQAEKPIVVVSETIKIKPEMMKLNYVYNIIEAEISVGHGNEEQKPVLDKTAVFQAGRAEDIYNSVTHDVALDFQLTKNKGNVLSSNIDEREVADESGLDLFDEKIVAGQYYSYVVHGNAKGKYLETNAQHNFSNPDLVFDLKLFLNPLN
jgi:hypothetical protein